MSVDRRAINVLLAVLEIEHEQLAEAMGYRRGYVANVLSGATPVSDGFRDAFGDALAELLLGPRSARRRYPAAPLAEFIRRRAADAANKTKFYDDLGVSPQGWGKRRYVTDDTVDRVCCALGVHPSAIYGRDFEVAS